MTFVCKNSYGLREDVESVIVRVQCVPPKLYTCGNGRSSAVLAAITVCNQRLFVPTKVALYTFNHLATGGMVLGGTADVDSDEAYNEFGSGGGLVAGQSLITSNINILGSAGVVVAGDGIIQVSQTTGVSGGAQLAGSADNSVINDLAATGGSFIGGASEAEEIGGPTEGAGGTAEIQYTANPPTDGGAESEGVADEEVV